MTIIDYRALALLHLQCGSILLGAAALLLEEESVSPSFDNDMVDEMINVAIVDMGYDYRDGRKRRIGGKNDQIRSRESVSVHHGRLFGSRRKI